MSRWWLLIPAGLALVGAVFLLRLVLLRLADKRMEAYQRDSMKRHYDEVQLIYQKMRGWRHDYHNHIQTMKAHMALSQYGALDAYLGKLDTDLDSIDTLLKTGNPMLDAILNSKVSLAGSRGIALDVKVQVPQALTVSEIDLCVVFGNLIDNAVEACLRMPEGAQRFIRVYIGTLKGQLYLSVSNAMAGKAKRQGAEFPSAKRAGLGFGLKRVDAVAAKYGGYVNRQQEEGVFATEVLLPL